MRSIETSRLLLRAAVGPALCGALYASGHAHGAAPLLASLLLAGLLLCAARLRSPAGTFAFAAAGALFLALGFGLVPSLTPIILGTHAINTAKALAGLTALTFFPSRWHWNRRCSALALACLAIVPLLAWRIGYVHWAPAAIDAITLFALANLFSVIAEEWFFRRWIQQPLQRYGAVLSIVASALLFGLAHIGGGPVFMALAALAGVAYASVFHVSNSIWAALVLHLGLNVLRVALFGG